MNEKSIFKKNTCQECKYTRFDETGKRVDICPKCGVRMFPSAKWHVRITRQGRTTLRAISSRRQDAVNYLHAAKDAARLGRLLPGEEKVITWDAASKAFTKWIDGGNLSAATKEWYKLHLKHLSGFFDEDLQSITVSQVEAYRDQRTGVAPKTVAEEIKTLKRIYSLHCRWNSARVAPDLHSVAADLANVEMPKYNNKRTRFLSESEVSLLLASCEEPHLKLAIQIALSTGLRLSNIMGLEWRQIDHVNRSITFRAEDMKSRRVHVSPLMGSLSAELQAWRKGQKRLTPYVFPSPTVRNRPMSNMRTSWENTIEACNAILQKKKQPDFSDVVFHTLRHTFASHFLMAGGDLATLSELLDHASIQITKDRYGHLSGEHKRKAIDAFEGVFFAAAGDR